MADRPDHIKRGATISLDGVFGWKRRAQRAEAEVRRLRALTEGDPYSIYYEAAEMRSELMHLRRWKLEAAEVIESWERLDAAEAERDEYRRQLDTLRDAIAAHEDCCGTDFWPELQAAVGDPDGT